ncbi:hypothetical protein BDN72DRAFT_867976 [Pluteus cervinus]|uniref:Uncharacterized protein n=1 Tax=Pluteus cervinus TaxID=181527 RepID=A0ACD3BDR1_9AGAR|nr:hypothetical protein BDN72DRAFT_867976 [Pluteus cervinus]
MGRPIRFETGQFSGQTIRAELHEIQKADLGRKYARVDRRPLDPPPVVQLRLFEVFNEGTSQETERELRSYDDVEVLGLMCTVDLFPVFNENQRATRVARGPVTPSPNSQSLSPSRYQGARSYPYTYTSSDTSYNHIQSAHLPHSPTTNGSSAMHASGLPVSPPSYPHRPPPLVQAPPDVVHRVGDFVVTESSKVTQNLVGATFVQPWCVDYQGKKALLFVFSDLAVKIEGNFILRYRVFDIFSKPSPTANLPIQAECYGGTFRVYSTKEFPGLQASTELTKQLAMWGVRLNIRETERRRRRRGERSPSPQLLANGKRKYASPGSADGYNSSED